MTTGNAQTGSAYKPLLDLSLNSRASLSKNRRTHRLNLACRRFTLHFVGVFQTCTCWKDQVDLSHNCNTSQQGLNTMEGNQCKCPHRMSGWDCPLLIFIYSRVWFCVNPLHCTCIKTQGHLPPFPEQNSFGLGLEIVAIAWELTSSQMIAKPPWARAARLAVLGSCRRNHRTEKGRAAVQCSNMNLKL